MAGLFDSCPWTMKSPFSVITCLSLLHNSVEQLLADVFRGVCDPLCSKGFDKGPQVALRPFQQVLIGIDHINMDRDINRILDVNHVNFFNRGTHIESGNIGLLSEASKLIIL